MDNTQAQTSERERLSDEQITWLRRLTGTYDADSAPGYYQLMERLFDQAFADAEKIRALEAMLKDITTIHGIAVTQTQPPRSEAGEDVK